MARPPELGAGITHWKDELRVLGLGRAAAGLVDHPKLVTLEYLRQLQLPTNTATIVNAATFHEDPEPYFAKLGASTDKFFVALEDRLTLQRTRKLNLTRDEAQNYVAEVLRGRSLSSYDVFLRQYFPTHYLGSIVASRSGDITASMAPIIASGIETQLKAWKMLDDASFSYSFEDIGTRTLLYRAISHVPHDSHDYMPGLYEFIIDQPGELDSLRPIFLDYFPSFFD